MKDSENPIIIAGDFNRVLHPDMDCKDYININNPRTREQVLNLMIECILIDSWRKLNLEARQYTWSRKNSTKLARLDFFLIFESIFMDVISAKILPGYKTEHSQIALQFDFGKFEKGKSYWKFNNSLLKDQKYVSEIKHLIKFTKLNYVQLDEYITENNINAILDQQWRFSM